MKRNLSKNNCDQHHRCYRENCCGAENHQPNYISVTSRQVTPSQSKKKKIKTKKVTVKQILQDSYNELKIQNEKLQKKLNAKQKKYEELKTKLKDYEAKMSLQLTSERPNVNEKYSQIIAASQQLAKHTLQRYKVMEEEYYKYKQSTEKKISRLQKEKEQIIKQTQRNNGREDKSIDELRRELKRMKEEQLTAPSLKNIAHYEKQTQLSKQNSHLKQQIESFRSEVRKLKVHNQNLQNQLQSLNIESRSRQEQLRSNLDLISEKVNIWERDYRKMQQDATQWEIKYNKLLDKYERRREKQRLNNEEWAGIFKEFLVEIDKLKKQLETVSQRNIKLIKMYAHQ